MNQQYSAKSLYLYLVFIIGITLKRKIQGWVFLLQSQAN